MNRRVAEVLVVEIEREARKRIFEFLYRLFGAHIETLLAGIETGLQKLHTER